MKTKKYTYKREVENKDLASIFIDYFLRLKQNSNYLLDSTTQKNNSDKFRFENEWRFASLYGNIISLVEPTTIYFEKTKN